MEQSNINKKMKTKITLSGEVASGKSTVGKLLAEERGYEFVSIGNITRNRAEREGLTIVDFQKKCVENPLLDKEIDLEFAKYCNSKQNLIIDYRMGFKFVDNCFNVFLKISEEDAVERLKIANRKNETFETVRERNNTFKTQFQNAYEIDYTLDSNYDLIIAINNTMTAEEIKTMVNNFKCYPYI